MWQLQSLRIQNLFSYQDSSIDFENRNSKLTCIYGSNKTDPKVLSNGSGKTSLLDCIALGLTGSPLRQISKKDIVRNGFSSGELELSLVNKVLDKHITIKIFPHVSKTNKVEIWEDDNLNEQLVDLNPKESHKYILSLLDISEDDLLNYYLLGRDTYTSFFTTKDSEKKDVINRFSKANLVDPIDTYIKTDISIEEKNVIEIDKTIAAKQASIQTLQEQLEKAQQLDPEQEREKLIEPLNNQILDLDSKILSLEEQITDLNEDKLKIKEKIEELKTKSFDKQLLDISSKITAIDLSIQAERKVYISIEQKYETKVKDTDTLIKKLESDFTETKNDKNDTLDLISEIERHMADEIECPKCKHKFCFKDHAYDLEEAKKKLPQFKQDIIDLTSKITQIITSLDKAKADKAVILNEKSQEQDVSVKKGKELTSQLNALNVEELQIKQQARMHEKEVSNLESSIVTLETSVTTKQSLIETYGKQIEALFKEIDLIKEKQIEDKSKDLLEQIENKQVELQQVVSEKEEVETKKRQLETWRLRFKKFKSHLANNSITMIESLCNHYLQSMHTNLSVMIDGFREKVDGTLKEEITVEVSRDGVNKESFYKFSGGEKAKMDVSSILAMQKLINLNSKSGGLDLLFIDEIIDAIDRVALNELVLSLDSLNQTILLISHIDLPDMENSIKVEKQLGISQIINN